MITPPDYDLLATFLLYFGLLLGIALLGWLVVDGARFLLVRRWERRRHREREARK